MKMAAEGNKRSEVRFVKVIYQLVSHVLSQAVQSLMQKTVKPKLILHQQWQCSLRELHQVPATAERGNAHSVMKLDIQRGHAKCE